MQDIELRPVGPDNFSAVAKMQVAEGQRGFVASNLYSLAEAYAYSPLCTPLAVYAGGVPVGFVMYCIDDDDHDFHWLCRLMIDEQHQRKGYGRAAMRAALDRIRAEGPKAGILRISYEPENVVAEALYVSLGFYRTGRMSGGEKVLQTHIGESPVQLREITPENYGESLALSVAPEQQRFVAPNAESLVQAMYSPDTRFPLAIYAGGEMAGFLLHGPGEDGAHWMHRLMIDQRFQRRGYGRAAVGLLTDGFSEDGTKAIAVSIDPQNEAAAALYRSLGFAPTGEMLGSETVYRKGPRTIQ